MPKYVAAQKGARPPFPFVDALKQIASADYHMVYKRSEAGRSKAATWTTVDGAQVDIREGELLLLWEEGWLRLVGYGDNTRPSCYEVPEHVRGQLLTM